MSLPNSDRTLQGSHNSGRKAYQAPRLCCYGDVGAITQAAGSMTNPDGATMGNQKTA